MIRRDYIIRKIEEFGKALSLLRKLLNTGDRRAFEEEIEQVSRHFTGTELTVIESLSEEKFATEIICNDQLLLEEKKMIAHLLFEKLHYYLETGNRSGTDGLYPKVYALYKDLHVVSDEKFDLEIHYRLDFLQKLLEE